jgi:hypothetical protein
MTRAYQGWPEIDHPTAWARTAASRKLARSITRIGQDPVEQLPERNSLLPVSIDVETWEGRHEILGVLNRLSPQQRHVMAWTLDGHAPAEIASELQICFQTVRANLIQAHNTLAAYLGTTGDEQTTDVGSPQDQGLDLWLSYQQHKLVIDVIGTLEIEAGLREVLIPTHHADLARCPDVEAEGASIVPIAPDIMPATEPLTPNCQPADSEPVTATNPDQVNVEHAQPDTRLLEFFPSTASWNPSTRLAMRAHPIFHLAGFHDRVHTLVLSAGSASTLASGLEGTLEYVLHRVRDRVPDLPPDLDGALDRDLDRGLDPARDLGNDLDRTLDRARAVARDLVRDLGSELAHIRDLDRLPTVDLSYALDNVLNLDSALNHNLTPANNYAHLGIHDLAHYHVRVRALIRGLERIQSFADELIRTIQTLAHFHRVLSDVSGVDLRNVEFAEIPLQGLRWSMRTQWPPKIENQIRRDSVQVADGIFEVGDRGTT